LKKRLRQNQQEIIQDIGRPVYKGSPDIYCRFYKDYRNVSKTESCNHDTSKEISKKKYVYIIKLRCHGNGGWCGSTIIKEFSSMAKALRTKPRWEPEYSPYDGHILNHPRLSPTNDINDARYIFDWEDDRWKER
jgi:hypothetical protein